MTFNTLRSVILHRRTLADICHGWVGVTVEINESGINTGLLNELELFRNLEIRCRISNFLSNLLTVNDFARI